MTGRPLNREEEIEWGSKCTAKHNFTSITAYNVINKTSDFESSFNTTSVPEANSTLLDTLLKRLHNSTFTKTFSSIEVTRVRL